MYQPKPWDLGAFDLPSQTEGQIDLEPKHVFCNLLLPI